MRLALAVLFDDAEADDAEADDAEADEDDDVSDSEDGEAAGATDADAEASNSMVSCGRILSSATSVSSFFFGLHPS